MERPRRTADVIYISARTRIRIFETTIRKTGLGWRADLDAQRRRPCTEPLNAILHHAPLEPVNAGILRRSRREYECRGLAWRDIGCQTHTAGPPCGVVLLTLRAQTIPIRAHPDSVSGIFKTE